MLPCAAPLRRRFDRWTAQAGRVEGIAMRPDRREMIGQAAGAMGAMAAGATARATPQGVAKPLAREGND